MAENRRIFVAEGESRRVDVRLGQSRTGQVFKAGSAISSSAADALRDRGSKKQQGIVEVSEIFTSIGVIFSMRFFLF